MSVMDKRKVYDIDGRAVGAGACLYEEAGRTRGWVEIQSLWGPYPTWADICAALWWEDGSPQEHSTWWDELYAISKEASLHRYEPWRVEKRKGMSGCEDYRVRIQDLVAAKWGTAGKITSSLHVSCKWKVQLLKCPIEDLWVYFDEVPCMGVGDAPFDKCRDRVREEYKGTPIREVACGMELDWMPAGAISGEDPDPDPIDEEPEPLSEEARERLIKEYAGEEDED